MASNRASLALSELDAFVDMLASATGLPAWRLEGWLEIYWKLRVLDCLEEEERRGGVESPAAAEVGPEEPAAELALAPEEPERLVPPSEPEPEPLSPPKLSGNGKRAKREIFQRLTAARSNGVTVAQIVAASLGGLRESEILTAINCEQLHISKWTAIGKALEALGY